MSLSRPDAATGFAACGWIHAGEELRQRLLVRGQIQTYREDAGPPPFRHLVGVACSSLHAVLLHQAAMSSTERMPEAFGARLVQAFGAHAIGIEQPGDRPRGAPEQRVQR